MKCEKVSPINLLCVMFVVSSLLFLPPSEYPIYARDVLAQEEWMEKLGLLAK
jgi:hypothetical protein